MTGRGRGVCVLKMPAGLAEPIKPPGIDELPENQRRGRQIEYLLSRDPSEFFEVRRDALACLPSPARIRDSIPCESCGEMVMSTRLRERGQKNVCIPCDENDEKESMTL